MYQTGEALQRYLKNRRVALKTARDTDPLKTVQRYAVATMPPVETQRLPYNKQLTALMPIASSYPPIPQPRRLPYLEVRRDDNPMFMLYNAYAAAIMQRHMQPGALFLHETLIPALERETLDITGRLYDGHFYVYSPKIPGKVARIPVFSECLLPLPVLEAIGGVIRRDSVICLFDD